MKIKCNRQALHEAVQLAASIVPARSPKPILQCACFLANQADQTLSVMATDSELTINVLIPGVLVEDGGIMVLPADRMNRLLQESKDDNLDLELVESTCHIKGQDSYYNIFGHNPDSYPEIEAGVLEAGLEITSGVLKKMIRMSSFAAARESSRYALNGVLWEISGKKIRMVATDGRRLAQSDGFLGGPGSSQGDISAIVPVKVMQIVEKVISDDETKVFFSIENNQIRFMVGDSRITANLLQGRFPKYADVIPKGCEYTAHIQKESFFSAVRRAALLANDHTNAVVLEFSPDNLHLYSSTPEAGEADINMPVAYDGPEIKIGFNPHYIAEALRVIDTPEILMEFSGSNKPGILRSGKDFLYVLMPVNID